MRLKILAALIIPWTHVARAEIEIFVRPNPLSLLDRQLMPEESDIARVRQTLLDFTRKIDRAVALPPAIAIDLFTDGGHETSFHGITIGLPGTRYDQLTKRLQVGVHLSELYDEGDRQLLNRQSKDLSLVALVHEFGHLTFSYNLALRDPRFAEIEVIYAAQGKHNAEIERFSKIELHCKYLDNILKKEEWRSRWSELQQNCPTVIHSKQELKKLDEKLETYERLIARSWTYHELYADSMAVIWAKDLNAIFSVLTLPLRPGSEVDAKTQLRSFAQCASESASFRPGVHGFFSPVRCAIGSLIVREDLSTARKLNLIFDTLYEDLTSSLTSPPSYAADNARLKAKFLKLNSI